MNKYLRPLDAEEYLHKWDIPITTDMVQMAQFPKEVADLIWEEERAHGVYINGRKIGD